MRSYLVIGDSKAQRSDSLVRKDLAVEELLLQVLARLDIDLTRLVLKIGYRELLHD